MKTRFSLYLVIMMFSIVACSDDTESLKPYTHALAEISTNGYGKATELILDDGSRFDVKTDLSELVPDTTYRVLVSYVINNEGVDLYGVSPVISSVPLPVDLIEVKNVPLRLQSIWKTQRYLNMLVDVETGGKTQYLGFVDYGIQRQPSGIQKLCLGVYHDQTEDPYYYTESLYLSCPIYRYAKQLERGKDSIEISLPTSKGVITKGFVY